jgi:hypothetical protein
MLEGLLDDLLVLYEAYSSHATRALWTYKRIHLPGSSPGQAAILNKLNLYMWGDDENWGMMRKIFEIMGGQHPVDQELS